MIELGIDALDFVNKLEGGWDTIILDYPYWEKDGKDRGARLNKMSKLNPNDNKFFMDQNYIIRFIDLLEGKLASSGVIIQFHNERLEEFEYEHIWFKGDAFGGMGAGYQTRNDEYIYIKRWGNAKLCQLPGLPRILHYPVGNFTRIPRRCYKPKDLFKRLYLHCNSSYILDAFAGYGNSIQAAYEMGLSIDACDIDASLKKIWYKYNHRNIQTGLNDFAES